MKIKQTKNILVLSAIVLAVVASVASTAFVGAAECATNGGSGGDYSTSILPCPDASGGTVETSGVWGILLFVINILTAGVGLAAVAGVVYGAILYTTASGDPAKVKKALSTFTNLAIGVVAYAAMFAVLNFITPGGLFN